MKKILVPAALALALAACTGASSDPRTLSLDEHLSNPLFAERYWSELTERMVEIQIRNKNKTPEEKSQLAAADGIRAAALSQSQAVNAKRHEGLYGNFVPVSEETQGPVLILDNVLYLAPHFQTLPGPSLHLYLTTAIDPRDLKFPDPSALDLGLESPYGDQAYQLPEKAKDFVFHSVVLYDAKLQRIHGFAQISK